MAEPVTQSDTPEERDLRRLRNVAAVLMEHFDSIQIFATRHEGDDNGTVNAHHGAGNWYARYGQVKEWVTKQEQPPGE